MANIKGHWFGPVAVTTPSGHRLMPNKAMALQKHDPAAYVAYLAQAHASFGGCEAALEDLSDDDSGIEPPPLPSSGK